MSSPEVSVGFLRPNTSKNKPSQPDFRGTWNLAGNEVMVSAWWKEKDGEKMLSLSITLRADMDAHKASGAAGSPPAAGRGYLYPNGSEAFKGRVSLNSQDYRLSGSWREQNGEAVVEVRSNGVAGAARPSQASSAGPAPAGGSSSSPAPRSSTPAPAPAPTPVSSGDLSDLGLGDIFDT